MPFSALATRVRDSNQTKVCTITCLDNDPPGSVQAYIFAAAIGGMRPCYRAPAFAHVEKLTGPASASEFQVVPALSGFQITKLTAGIVGALITLSVEIS